MPINETDEKPIDYGSYMEVTSAVTGRRAFINKLAVMYINEVEKNGLRATYIWFDKDMYVPAAESYEDIIELFMEEDEIDDD
ncbi:MAG: hypothetical protein J6Y02_17250 [Pseudobutyrivibrio sp.]|nr:hypothetical protein [Pseudobutyrivibrio sp.]